MKTALFIIWIVIAVLWAISIGLWVYTGPIKKEWGMQNMKAVIAVSATAMILNILAMVMRNL